jgi:hypothetical protein
MASAFAKGASKGAGDFAGGISDVAKAAEGAARAGTEGAAGAAKGAAKNAAEAAEATAKNTAETAAEAAKATAKNTEDIAKLSDNVAELRKAENAKAAAKTPEEIAVASAKATELRKMIAQTVMVGGVIGAGLYLEDKYNKADEDTKDCVKTCLPENWDGFEYGTLKKKELKFSTLPNTSEQPVCKQSMNDCGEYCDKKCTAIHEYKMPGSKAAEGLAGSLGGAVGGVTGSFFEAFNPFAGMSMFGEFTWLPFLISIMCIGIILVWGISKLR